MTELESELRDKIIQRLQLEDIDKDSIQSDTILFGEGLALDSIDALELELMIKEEYGIIILTSERNRSTFGSLGELSEFIVKNCKRDIDKIQGKGTSPANP